MATPFTAFRPSPILCSSASSNRRKPPSASSSANWWTLLFGWPTDPDYITSNNKEPVERTPRSSDSDPGRAGPRFGVGCFTEEKARELRRKTAEITTFHDVMYHSAIASRLASGTTSEN
ncbi:uncharacterized protein LOC131335454 [Rhododendron vialii]|uniref:uncharacterized protein LOC131335454 n=1 Tax=Rhododendron vialii TaxID=182163 RepID=UPI00265D8119|nr:uncharacterized protein LOC131335454 [Rhododendron vialii]